MGDQAGQRLLRACTEAAVLALLLPLLLLLLLSCGAEDLKEAVEPPDTRVVGQSLGSALAMAYAATLAQHALAGGESPCHELLLPAGVPTGEVEAVDISVDAACGFPFPGRAQGSIRMVGVDPGTEATLGAAEFSNVRVDGRSLPIQRAAGFFAIDPEELQEHGLDHVPEPQEGFRFDREDLLIVLFFDAVVELADAAAEVDTAHDDEWVVLVDRNGTLADFSDDWYFVMGRRWFTGGDGSGLNTDVAVFSPECRENPLAGYISLTHFSETETNYLSWLAFVPECKGDGFVVLSLSDHVLSTGRRVPLDLLGREAR